MCISFNGQAAFGESSQGGGRGVYKSLENALAGTSLGSSKSEGATETQGAGVSRNAEAKQAASRNIDDAFADL